MSAIDVESRIVIDRPRREVAAFMFDPANDRIWTKNVIDCRPLTEGPLRAGSRVERTVRFLGRQFSYEYEVLATDGDRVVEIRVDRPFPMQVRYQLDDVGTATAASIRCQGDASGFFAIAGPLMAPMVRGATTKDLEALKAHLENRSA